MLQINRSELATWIASGKKFRLIDVREEWEHLLYNIGGELIPLGELNAKFQIEEIDTPVVFYCKKGIRSQIAIQRLSLHYPDAIMYNLTGGIGQ